MLSVLTKFLYSITRNFMSHFMSHSIQVSWREKERSDTKGQNNNNNNNHSKVISSTPFRTNPSPRDATERHFVFVRNTVYPRRVIDRRESVDYLKEEVLSKVGVSINFLISMILASRLTS